MNLDAYQHAAAITDAPHVLVVAGPGSGKTRTLTARVGHLLDQGCDPGRILVVTFTNKAAAELCHRIGRPDMTNVGTFHSLMLRLVVRPHAAEAGFAGRPAVVDEATALAALVGVARAWNAEHAADRIPDKRADLAGWAADFSWAKNHLARPAEPTPAAVFDRYCDYLSERSLVDFDDLLTVAVLVLADHGEVRRQVAGAFDHILVDEYQDTNIAQVDLVRLLASEGAHVFAVGDPAQSVYGFRGADQRNVDRLRDIFPGLVTFELPVSYRCPTAVLGVANRLAVTDMFLVAGGQPDGAVHVVRRSGLADQGSAVAGRIAHLVEAGVPPSDIAVIYRRRSIPAETRVGQRLRAEGIPYREVGGLDMTRHAEAFNLTDFAAWTSDPVRHEATFDRLRGWLSPHLDLGIGPKAVDSMRAEGRVTGDPLVYLLTGRGKRRPDGGTGGDHLAKLVVEGHARCADGPEAFLRWAVETLDYGRWLEDHGRDDRFIEELLAAAGRAQVAGITLADFLDALALEAGPEATPEGRVTLTTAHAAKGLEWPHVLVIGVDADVWPSRRAVSDDEQAEEERLFYVAVTRAQQSLTVVTSTGASSHLLDAVELSEGRS